MVLEKNEIEPYWTEKAKSNLVGRTIVDVRYMTQKEKRDMYWCDRPVVLILDDGSEIYPSQDDEGNGAGALFGTNGKGEDILLPVIR